MRSLIFIYLLPSEHAKTWFNLLPKSCRSIYSCLNSGTVVSNDKESGLGSFEGHGNSFHVTPLSFNFLSTQCKKNPNQTNKKKTLPQNIFFN